MLTITLLHLFYFILLQKSTLAVELMLFDEFHEPVVFEDCFAFY